MHGHSLPAWEQARQASQLSSDPAHNCCWTRREKLQVGGLQGSTWATEPVCPAHQAGLASQASQQAAAVVLKIWSRSSPFTLLLGIT